MAPIKRWFVFFLALAAAFAGTRTASAAEFYATFETSAGVFLGAPRQQMPGVAFAHAAKTAAQRQDSFNTSVDAGANTAELYRSLLSQSRIKSVLFEFVQVGADQTEHVYLVVRLTGVQITSMSTAFTAAQGANAASNVSALVLTAESSETSDGGAPSAKRVFRSAAALTLPLIAMAPKRPARMQAPPSDSAPVAIDDCYVAISSIAGESADHPGQIHVQGLSITATLKELAGSEAGSPLVARPMSFSKVPGSATAGLLKLLNATTRVTLKFEFVQKPPEKPELVRYTLTFKGAQLKADSVQVAAGQSAETLSFTWSSVEVKNTTTGVSVTAHIGG